MKRFIWLLVLAAAAYAVYKYYPELEKLARQRTAAQEEKAKQDPVDEASRTQRSAPAGDGAVSAPKEKTLEEQVAERYPMPQFKTIDDLTGQWKAIPPSAFPRKVTLKEKVNYVMTGAGTAVGAVGSPAVALSGSGGTLTIAMNNETSAFRAQVPVEHTDLKEVLGKVYEGFKERQRAKVTKAREAALAEAKKAKSGPAPVLNTGAQPAPAEAAGKIGPKPAQNADGTVPLVVASINQRQSAKRDSEPKLAEIRGWGQVTFREVEGQPYWCSSVRYTARTIFGEFPTEAWALIQNGQVQKWVYAGTREPLP